MIGWLLIFQPKQFATIYTTTTTTTSNNFIIQSLLSLNTVILITHLSLSSPSFPPPSTNKQLFDVLDQVSRFGLQRASFLGIQTTMALNCLTSCQFMDGNMSDSDGEHRRGECCRKLCCVKVWRRRCQGNILLYETMRIGTLNMATEKVRKSHCRSYSTGVAAFVGGTEPRLVRSCAMRRDWSFEDVSRG